MRLNNYIVTSLLSHILLLGILVVFHPEMNTGASAPIFDVDIVGSIPPTPSPSVSKESEEKGLSPETMFGQGTESEPADTGKEKMANAPLEKATDKVGSKDINADGGLMPPSEHPGKENSLTGFTDKEGVLPEGAKGLPLEPKSFLFDKETIEKYAQKGTTKEKGLTFDVPEFHHRGYMRMLKDKIESIWKYPKWAARRGISGDLYIKFSIKRNGSLGEVELIRTSGYKYLDEAAIKALKDGEPYWPLPDDWEGDELSITGHFIYLIGRAYII